MSELLTLKEAAATYGITPSRMTRLVRRTRIPTHANPADRRSKLVRRADIELSLGRDLPPQGSDELRALMHEWGNGARRSGEALSGRGLIPVDEALRVVRGETETDWPPAGSRERRALTLEALEKIWRGTEELRNSGRRFLPAVEALDIVRGAIHE